MLHCPQCRALNLEGVRACLICGAILDEDNVGPPGHRSNIATAGIVPSQLAMGAAGVIVLVAAIAGGVWTATDERVGFAVQSVSLTYFVTNSDIALWSFLVPATFPMAVALFLLAKAGDMGGGARAHRLWPYGFLAGIMVVVAGIASGVFAASEANNAQFWLFLLVASSPVGLGVVLMITSQNQREGSLWPGTATFGILAGMVLVVAAIALGIKIATDVSEDYFWAFLLFAIVPLGIGLLAFVSAQGLREGENQGGGLPGQFIGLVVIIGGVALAGYFAKETEPHDLLMFLLFATTPMGIGLLVLLSAGNLTGDEDWRIPPVLGMLLGALVAVVGIVGGIWWSIEIEESHFWVTLLIATPQVGIGLLSVAEAQRVRIILQDDEPIKAVNLAEDDPPQEFDDDFTADS